MATRREKLQELFDSEGGDPGTVGEAAEHRDSGQVLLTEIVEAAEKTYDSDQPRTRVKVPTEKKERSTRGRGTAAERSLQQIQDQFEEQLNTILSLFSLAMPVTGVYATENSEKAVTALFNIAKRRPKLLAALSKTADGIDAVAIGQYALGIGVALQVDLGRMDPHSLPARAFGVEKVFMEYFEESDSSIPVNPNVFTIEHPYVQFQPVS